jgi:hypothetical protein
MLLHGYKLAFKSHVMANMFITSPMLMPRLPNLPHFNGEHVIDFLDSPEAHAMTTNVALNNLLAYVLCCCQCCICTLIDSGCSTAGPP